MTIEKCEDILATIHAAERYLRTLAAMQLPFESVVAIEARALDKTRRALAEAGVSRVVVPASLRLAAFGAKPVEQVVSQQATASESLVSFDAAEVLVTYDEPVEAQVEVAPAVEPEALVDFGDDPDTLVDFGDEPESLVEIDSEPESLVDFGDEPESLVEIDPEPESLVDFGDEPESLVEIEPEPESLVEVDVEDTLEPDEPLAIDQVDMSAAPDPDDWEEEEVTNIVSVDRAALLDDTTSDLDDFDLLADEDEGDAASDADLVIAKVHYDEEEEDTDPSVYTKKKAPGAKISIGKPSPAGARVAAAPRVASAPRVAAGPRVAAVGPRVAAVGPRVAAGAKVEVATGAQASARASARAAGLYGPNVPTIRETKEPKPKAAAIQLGVTPQGGSSAKILGHEEEEEALEIGDAGDYGDEDYDDEDDDDDDDDDEGGGFSLDVAEYEEEEEEWEEEEEEEDAPPPPPPEPTGPTAAELGSMLEAARAAQDRGELDEAINLYSDVLDGDPEHVLAYVGRGRLYLDIGDYARAMSDFIIAEEEAPDDPEPQVAIGDLYFARKDYRKAIEYFDAALGMDANHPMAFCRRGISHYYRKNYKQALKDLTRAQKLDQDIPNIRTFITMAKKRAK